MYLAFRGPSHQMTYGSTFVETSSAARGQEFRYEAAINSPKEYVYADCSNCDRIGLDCRVLAYHHNQCSGGCSFLRDDRIIGRLLVSCLFEGDSRWVVI